MKKTLLALESEVSRIIFWTGTFLAAYGGHSLAASIHRIDKRLEGLVSCIGFMSQQHKVDFRLGDCLATVLGKAE